MRTYKEIVKNYILICNTNNYHTFSEIAIRTLELFVITSA